MGFKIEPAGLKDAKAIADMMMAVSTSPRIELEFENCQREDWLDWNIKAAQSELQACGKYPDEAVALKVVDEESGDVAGYAVWGWSERASDLIFSEKASLPLPTGTNTSLRKTFISTLQSLEITHRPSASYFELLELVTSPKYQRCGVGSQLVNFGLEKADQEGVVCFLSASPMGVLLYRKMGFEEVGRLEMELERFGGEGRHVHVAMIRKPKGVVKEQAQDRSPGS